MRNSHSAPMDCESPSLPAPGHESGDPEAPIGLRTQSCSFSAPFLALTAAKHPWVLLLLAQWAEFSSGTSKLHEGFSWLCFTSSSCDVQAGERT